MRPVSWQSRSSRHQDTTGASAAAAASAAPPTHGFLSLPPELRSKVIDYVLQDGDARDDGSSGGGGVGGDKRTRPLASLRECCTSIAYDPYINSLLFETVPLSCKPSLIHLLSTSDLSHITPHIRHVEFCQTLLDWRAARKACRPAAAAYRATSTRLGKVLNRRRRANAFHRCVNDVHARPCFSRHPGITALWAGLLVRAPHVSRVSFRYCSARGGGAGAGIGWGVGGGGGFVVGCSTVVPHHAVSWMKRHVRRDDRSLYCMKWYMHITQIFFATVVAALLEARPTIEALSVQHTLYPTFRWEQVPRWHELDFTHLRKLDYSSFSPTRIGPDRMPPLSSAAAAAMAAGAAGIAGGGGGGNDHLAGADGPFPLSSSSSSSERLDNFTSLLRQCCHSLEELTVDAMWYSAADPNEYVVLPWPDDYSLTFPRLTDLRLRRVRLRWKQAARYLERMPALRLLSCRDTGELRPRAGKPLWDVVRRREHKPRIESGYRGSCRVLFDPAFEELPAKYSYGGGGFGDRGGGGGGSVAERDWELQKRAQLWTYLAGKGRWTQLLELGF